MSNSDYAVQKLSLVNDRITQACKNSNRNRESVTLIGAGKKQHSLLLKQFIDAGLKHLGENYLQEAIEKQEEIAQLSPTLIPHWHFIGQIQSNKTKAIARHFSWVHGVDRVKIATRLAQQNEHPQAIKVLIQLNPDLETSKGGIALEQASELADQIAAIEGLSLRGFMMIPRARETVDEQRRVFAKARHTLEQSNQRYGLNLDHLSMGMSGDLEAAIEEGSTLIRIGTDLFGARD